MSFRNAKNLAIRFNQVRIRKMKRQVDGCLGAGGELLLVEFNAADPSFPRLIIVVLTQNGSAAGSRNADRTGTKTVAVRQGKPVHLGRTARFDQRMNGGFNHADVPLWMPEQPHPR